jgi:hypothetical protein
MQTSKFPLWICALALCGGMTLRADDTPAQAAARAALNQKMQEMEGGSAAAPQTPAAVELAPAPVIPTTPPPAATVAVPAEAPAAPVVAPATTPAAPEPVVAQAGDTEAQAKARAALNEKMSEIGLPAPVAPAATSVPVATAAGLKPITAPALPINMTKAGKLDWLLSLYKSDQITPEQYHAQRAAILAAP